MSLNVLVIPEDPRKDGYMLRPIIRAMFRAIGKPQARVDVCEMPRLGGIGEALKEENLLRIIGDFPMVDIFLLCVDRDGEPGRAQRLRQLEEASRESLKEGRALLAENAWQEIEVWVLAGMDDLPGDWQWRAIREERDAKETYFEPYARSRNLLGTPGRGRKMLGEEAAGNYARIVSRCEEDVRQLQDRIGVWLDVR